jgi:acetyl esterase/lipase
MTINDKYVSEAAGRLVLPVWPGRAPGAAADSPAEVEISDQEHLVAGRPVVCIANVSTPTLTLYPAQGEASSAAVVVFPGGGYHVVAWDIEGTEACEWLSAAGITSVLLKYRVPGSGPYPDSSAALQDAQRAMGLVRSHAAEWKIDPARVGALGFSAGAYLAAALGTHFGQRLYAPIDEADLLSCRPDFSVLIYPGYLAQAEQNFALNPVIQSSEDTPPTFVMQTEDDPVHVENAVVYYMALKEAQVPAELHVYAQGGHAYGLRPNGLPVASWPKNVESWLRTIKVLPEQALTSPH